MNCSVKFFDETVSDFPLPPTRLRHPAVPVAVPTAAAPAPLRSDRRVRVSAIRDFTLPIVKV
jgi:hypothetical protein